MTDPTHLNNYDLLSRIMEDLNDFIDKRGNKQLIPALVAVKEQRDEVMRLRALVSELTDGYDEEFDPTNETTHLQDDAPRQQCTHCHRFTWAHEAFDNPCNMTQPNGEACLGTFRSVAIRHPAPSESCVHGTDPEQCPSCACRIDHGLPIGKLSTTFTNPSLQLRWEIEGVAHIEVEQTMMANRYNIASLYVDPEYQNLGIGTALMNIVLHEADLVGIELWLIPQAMPGMEENLHNFYMRFGFEDLGQSGYMIRKSPTAEPE